MGSMICGHFSKGETNRLSTVVRNQEVHAAVTKLNTKRPDKDEEKHHEYPLTSGRVQMEMLGH